MIYMPFPLSGCDMIAVAGKISVTQEKYALDFLKSFSSSRSNNDGYGAAWFSRDWQTVYKSGTRRWYGDGDYEPLTELKNWKIGETGGEEILLLHARNATEGYGSHPFMLEIDGKKWAFMHNGNISKQLYNYMLEYLGEFWFEMHPSNWVEDTEQMVDSEVLFHYLMSRYGSGIHFEETLADLAFLERNQIKKSVFNFILTDGTVLYAYRNSSMLDFDHKMSWTLEKGSLIIKTDKKVGTMLNPGELLIYRDGKVESKKIRES
jgi:predicted glutamine amidotransferase